MNPYLILSKSFVMFDGSKPDLTVGSKYEIVCSFFDYIFEVQACQILDDKGIVRTFYRGIWFSQHFTVHGDVDSVLEQI